MTRVRRIANRLGVASAVILSACSSRDALTITPATALTVHYLPDYEYQRDSASGFATSNHLVVFNPGATEAALVIQVLYEDRDPGTFTLAVPPMSSAEAGQEQWSVPPNSRFALVVTSSVPVVAQATIGWNNTLNDYNAGARAIDGGRPRETALSYIAHRAAATHWLLADGLVLDEKRLFIRESEWAVVLNPSTDSAHVTVSIGHGTIVPVQRVTIPPNRVRAVRLDDLVPHNQHYGGVVDSDVPVVVNWRRTVQWWDGSALMAFWSAPMVALSKAISGVNTALN